MDMAMGQAAAGTPPDPPNPPRRTNVPDGTGATKWYDSTDEDEDEEPPKRRRRTRRALEKNEDSNHHHARPMYSTTARGFRSPQHSEQEMPQYRPRIVPGATGSMYSSRAFIEQNSRVSSTASL
jgi:hypothetical protein